MNKEETGSYYDMYRKRAMLFQTIGIVMVAAAILLNEVTGRKMGAPVLALGIVGFIPLVIGGSSLRPHVIVRSFADLLRNDPSRRNAQEFLTALRKVGRTGLTRKSMGEVEQAIRTYEAQEGADAALAAEIRRELESRITRVVF